MKIRSIFLLLFLLCLCSQPMRAEENPVVTPLTLEQKVADFEYLYTTLRDNYPFFGVAERKYGVDWLAKHDEYVQRLRATADDTAYYRELNTILRELHDGHLDIFPTVLPEYFEEIYSSAPGHKKWVKMIRRSEGRAAYWSRMFSNKPRVNSGEGSRPVVSYYCDTMLCDGRVAYMRIESLDMRSLAVDGEKIDRFLASIADARCLVIDIQGNGGGDTRYWSEHIVPRLIDEPLEFSTVVLSKNGELNKYFKSRYFGRKARRLECQPEGGSLPDELFDGSYYVHETHQKIRPENPVAFEGEIFLLVDGGVFSSSGIWADFCKRTGWATLVGRTTATQGMGSDPGIVCLPESGILVRYPIDSGINADGSFNGETGIRPDVRIPGKNRTERLQNLLEYLSDRW